MKQAMLILTTIALATTISTRYSSDMAPAGSMMNPYVITDERGNETELQPRYIENPYPDDPDFAPGGMFNPLEIDR